MTDHPLSEEPFPNVQSELPLTQLHSICSSPIAGYHCSYLDEYRHSPYRLKRCLNPNCPCTFHNPLFQIISRADVSLPSSLELFLYVYCRYTRAFAPLLNPEETLPSTTFMVSFEEVNLYFCKCQVILIRSMAYGIEHRTE